MNSSRIPSLSVVSSGSNWIAESNCVKRWISHEEWLHAPASHYANQAVRVIATVTLAFQHLRSEVEARRSLRCVRRRSDEICHQPQDSPPAHSVVKRADFIAVWQISLAKLLRVRRKPSRHDKDWPPLVLINQPISQGLAECGGRKSIIQ